MFCRSPRQLVPPRLPKRFSVSSATPRSRQHLTRLIGGVSLAVSLLVPAMASSTVLAAEVAPSGRPPEVLSWRHQFLDSAEYRKLAGQWEAFVTANPTDARAWVEWGNALRYSGRGQEADGKYQRAFQVDSLDAAAVEAYASSIVSFDGDGPAWKAAHQLLVRSAARDPRYARTLYALWYSSLRAGDEALADDCLRRMVETGDMPRPLLEYGGKRSATPFSGPAGKGRRVLRSGKAAPEGAAVQDLAEFERPFVVAKLLECGAELFCQQRLHNLCLN
jgi:cytochrome c-type biogenesis protein CcmH/NrfG